MDAIFEGKFHHIIDSNDIWSQCDSFYNWPHKQVLDECSQDSTGQHHMSHLKALLWNLLYEARVISPPQQGEREKNI